MIGVLSVERCCGCAACRAVCPREAIRMCPDVEGFLQPVVDVARCVQCGLCRKACPVLCPGDSRQPMSVFAAQAKDDGLRSESSSGGIFSLLARQTLAKGGIVYGAAVRLTDGKVVHQSAETEGELSALRGSKYVQSDVGDVYRQARRQVLAGRQVLFSGTPCQIAAFRRVVGRDYGNLLCVDVICHAVPSPLAWEKYLEKRLFVQNQGRDSARAEGPAFRRISFRRKNCGWKRYSLSLRFANDREYLEDLQHDTFLRGFLSELYNRRSCHQCPVRGGRSGSDLTIGDYWRVWERFPELDDDKGTSVVLVNTRKGATAFATLATEVDVKPSDFADVIRTNPALVRSAPAHPKREQFFRLLRAGKDFDGLVRKLLKRPLWRRCGSLAKRLIRKALGR